MKKIILYGTKECHWTEKAKDLLEDKGINKFKFVDVFEDFSAREEIVSKTGFYASPVIEIGDAVIVGFDSAAMEKELI